MASARGKPRHRTHAVVFQARSTDADVAPRSVDDPWKRWRNAVSNPCRIRAKAVSHRPLSVGGLTVTRLSLSNYVYGPCERTATATCVCVCALFSRGSHGVGLHAARFASERVVVVVLCRKTPEEARLAVVYIERKGGRVKALVRRRLLELLSM